MCYTESMITTTDLKYALIALTDIEFAAVVHAAETERRRRVYASYAAQRQPYDVSRWNDLVKQYGEADYCRDYEDALDGFVIHTRKCTHWPKSFISSGECINLTRVR